METERGEKAYIILETIDTCACIILIHLSFQCNEIRKIDKNQTVIGTTALEMDKEDFDNDADDDDDDDDADNAEESEGDEFEQETG